MKKLLLISFPILLFVLSGCNLNTPNQTKDNINQKDNSIEQTSSEKGNNINLMDKEKENDITSYTDIKQFLGKPTILIWGSTSCPHCINAMPIFEKEVYNVYKDKINILLNTLSKDKFETTLPQLQNSPFSYQWVSGESCNYIPQWIMLDAEGNVVEKSCGGEKDVEEMKLKLKELGVE